MSDRRTTNIHEILSALVRTQEVIVGSPATITEEGTTFIISSLVTSGSDIEVKDEDGNVLLTGLNTTHFYTPLLIDNKFTITGTDLVVILGHLK